MKKIMLSIHPEFVEKILSGEKRFEYRTKAAKEKVDTLIIYETAPVKRIVAEAEVIETLKLPPEELWRVSKEQSGIDKPFFDRYFQGRTIAYAYRLGKITLFDPPRELADYGLNAAPQSYVYLQYNENAS